MLRQLSGRFQAKPPAENNQLIRSFNLTKGYQQQKSGVVVHDPNCFLFLLILCFFCSHPTPPPPPHPAPRPLGPAAGARAGPGPWNIPDIAGLLGVSWGLYMDRLPPSNQPVRAHTEPEPSHEPSEGPCKVWVLFSSLMLSSSLNLSSPRPHTLRGPPDGSWEGSGSV